ncbi:MAG: putative SAM-dependent methyltransferase [Methylophilaceae bacterium]|jgi:predicted SAM-dependent methyltransferase
MKEKIRLNLGCASRPLEGYINIDLDTKDKIIARYPNVKIPNNLDIFQYDIFNLPFDDCSILEIRSESMLEHLSFLEEKIFFYEMQRVLAVGGVLDFSVPDFEKTMKLWLQAEDNWKDFFRDDDEAIKQQHWFGQYSYSTDNKWGYLTASIFGPQNSEGQFHKNCYTEKKIRNMMRFLNFEILDMSFFRWKGDRDHMIRVRASKIK